MPTNAYHEALGVAAPALDDVLVRRPDTKLFHLLVLALLEAGQPMTDDEVAERLLSLGVRSRTGDLTFSLRKAWHGLPPVRRDPDGRLALDASSIHLRMLVRDLAPVAPRVRPPPIVVEALGDDVPLRRAEVDAALKGRLGAWSAPSVQRQVAALLDAEGPLAIDEVDRALASLGGRPISARDLAQWQRRSDAIGRDAEGRLALNALSDELPAMRRAIRKLAEPVLRRALERERQDAASAVHRERRLAVEKVEQERAAQARRVVVRAAPLPDEPLALCLLDVASRSICTLLGPDVRSVAERLAGYDVVVGLEIRQTLFALGVDPGERRIVDLGPPQKSLKIDQRGRRLAITAERILSSSVGMSLGDPGKLAEYLATGATTKLERRLEADVKALYALYAYGVLHRSVRLSWGFLDETFGVDWALPGDPTLFSTLRTAKLRGVPVDLVVGRTAPGWADPWSRAERVEVVDVEGYHPVVRGDREGVVPRSEIQAVRLVGDEP